MSQENTHQSERRRPPSPTTPLNASTQADQQKVADAFHKLGLIPKPLQVAEVVWRAPVRLAAVTGVTKP